MKPQSSRAVMECDGQPRDEAVLECSGLSKSFGGIHAVRNMALRVRPGLITGLIGPNGAGKSTLFNLISGVLRPDMGEVRLFGEEISGLRPYKIARKGMIRTFQLSREMARLTVLENLMLAPQGQLGEHLASLWFKAGRVRDEERRIEAQAWAVLDQIDLAQVRDEYAGNLSGGQKKLLELGRALMIDPEIILLDEPGAGVNPALMGLLSDMILRLQAEHGKTILIVEHDMDLIAKLCHRVVVMAEGRHLVEGSFDEVAADRRVIEAYLGGVS
ncbi:MAG: ABC transporter ATP-binding protein [Kiloniellaceae bacterium]